jgi:glycosyltransferase involved in cell wall biosynthesis
VVPTRHVARTRVTFFINSLEQGGAERQMAELVCGLDPREFDASVAVCIDRDQLGYRLPEGGVHCLDAPMFPSVASVRKLAGILDTLGTEVLHTYMGWENVFGRLAARMAHVRGVVSSVRCTELPRKHVLGERLTHGMADAIIVNSVGIRDELVRRVGIPRGRLQVIENGVDLQRFAPLPHVVRERERRIWGMEGRCAFLVPGRICAQKNQRGVLRALARMKRRGALPRDVKVVFAGRGSPPVYAEALRAYTTATGLSDQVEFLGVVHHIEQLVGAADAVLLPSEYEGLPNAVIESFACATPAIVSPPANVDRLVTDGREGLVCEGTSADAIAHALGRFLATAIERRVAMGLAGREHAARRFAVADMVDRTAAVYRAVLAPTKPGPRKVVRGAPSSERQTGAG